MVTVPASKKAPKPLERPPAPCPPVLPSKVVRVIVTVPLSLKRPPPRSALFLARMQSMRVSVPLLKMPPPKKAEKGPPLRRVSLCRVSVPATATFRIRPPPALRSMIVVGVPSRDGQGAGNHREAIGAIRIVIDRRQRVRARLQGNGIRLPIGIGHVDGRNQAGYIPVPTRKVCRLAATCGCQGIDDERS